MQRKLQASVRRLQLLTDQYTRAITKSTRVASYVEVQYLLPLREGCAAEPHGHLDDEVAGRPAEVRHARHPGPALEHGHLPPEGRAHQPQQVRPLVHRRVLRSVPEERPQPVLEVRVDVVLLAKGGQVVHEVVKGGGLLVQLGHYPADAAHHVGEDARAEYHRKDGKDPLRGRVGQHVAVADG
eukprot:scaffold117439_cov32-Prasinocladus_malaysianus.AAC.1